MGYILQQSLYNDTVSFGPYEGETISQSFVFGRRFQLNSINIRFGYVTIDPKNVLKLRCEVREATGENYLLDFDDEILMASPWYDEHSIISHTYHQFYLDRTELSAGTYYFSLVTNMRILYPINLSLQNTGNFNGKFIKISDGSGVYSNSNSLAVKIDGVWIASDTFENSSLEQNTYTTSTIRDMTS